MAPPKRQALDDVLPARIVDFLGRPARASNRMDPIADYCIARLRARQLPGLRGGSTGEKKVRGFGREKNWDVVCSHAGQPRILISLKSIPKNIASSVPNRVDDLMGEVPSVQMVRPEVAIGYVAILDLNGTTRSGSVRDTERNSRLFQEFRGNVERLAVRGMPNWNTGLIEACWIVEIDTSKAANPLPDSRRVVGRGEAFFDRLARLAVEREPRLLDPWEPGQGRRARGRSRERPRTPPRPTRARARSRTARRRHPGTGAPPTSGGTG